MERQSNAVGLGFAVASAVAFGTLAILARIADGSRPIPVLALRFLLTALILGGYLVATRRWVELHRGRIIRLLLLGRIGYVLQSSLYFLALDTRRRGRSPSSSTAIRFYSYPVWATVLALAARLERFTWRLIVPLWPWQSPGSA